MTEDDSTLLFLDVPAEFLDVESLKPNQTIQMLGLMPHDFVHVEGRWETLYGWSFPLPNGRLVVASWLSKSEVEKIKGHPYTRDIIIGYSWEDVWNAGGNYRDYVFSARVKATSVDPDGSYFDYQESILLANLKSTHEIVEYKIYPPFVLVDWHCPSFDLLETKSAELKLISESAKISYALQEITSLVRAANSLDEKQKKDILGYLEAAQSVIGMDSVDVSLLKDISSKALALAKRVGFVAGEKMISDLIDLILSTFF